MDHPKILIVDDEPFNIDYLEQELEDLHYDTVSAANGRQALAQVEVESPDIVLLDIMMPEMDGFQVLERLKADKRWRDIPVIVISAMSDMASVVKGIEMGAEDYLPKPFDEVLLRARLSASLEKKRLHDQEQLYLKGLERELEIGRQIQAGFLPAKLPQPSGWEIAARLQPAREVAGDFYDAFTMPAENKIGLVIGDVCNKGVGAALFMTLFRSLIRAISNLHYSTIGEMISSPGSNRSENEPLALPGSMDILRNTVTLTNNYVARTHSQASMFATLFFGLLDPATGSLLYINGGHEPPIIVGPTGVSVELKPTGPVVGILPDFEFKIQEVRLEPGDLLLAFTDGVTDALNPEGEDFTKTRLLALLEQPATSAASLLDRIEASLGSHTAGENQFDDITLLAVRRTPAPEA